MDANNRNNMQQCSARLASSRNWGGAQNGANSGTAAERERHTPPGVNERHVPLGVNERRRGMGSGRPSDGRGPYGSPAPRQGSVSRANPFLRSDDERPAGHTTQDRASGFARLHNGSHAFPPRAQEARSPRDDGTTRSQRRSEGPSPDRHSAEIPSRDRYPSQRASDRSRPTERVSDSPRASGSPRTGGGPRTPQFRTGSLARPLVLSADRRAEPGTRTQRQTVSSRAADRQISCAALSSLLASSRFLLLVLEPLALSLPRNATPPKSQPRSRRTRKRKSSPRVLSTPPNWEQRSYRHRPRVRSGSRAPCHTCIRPTPHGPTSHTPAERCASTRAGQRASPWYTYALPGEPTWTPRACPHLPTRTTLPPRVRPNGLS